MLKQKLFATTVTIVPLAILSTSQAMAQIVEDGSLGTQVDFRENNNFITGGTQIEGNLFHSFKQFSPSEDGITYFNNELSIQNIFTRVTGDIPSVIDGTIKANGEANLFLLNPAGIIFKDNVLLDIKGSFIASTAEKIIFADGSNFTTEINNTQPLLTVSIPVGLQYGNSVSGISSDLEPGTNVNLGVSPDRSIALLGGEVNLQNTFLIAPSGKIEIASIAESGTVNLRLMNNNWDFDYQDVSQFNNITIANLSLINTSGEGGIVRLQGKNITVNSASIVNATQTVKNGGEISLTASDSIILDSGLLSTSVGIVNEKGEVLDIPVTGKGGDIKIIAPQVSLNNGFSITADTSSKGNGGNIIIDASDSLSLSGVNKFAPSLIGITVGGSGEGGEIIINTANLFISDGARIDSSSFNIGTAGNIKINAEKSLSISGSSEIREETFISGIFASSGKENESLNTGKSGSLIITTPELELTQGGNISVSNFSTEEAGNISIDIEKLKLDSDSKIIANNASGSGGSIIINNDLLVLKDLSQISAISESDGNGGNITIYTDHLVTFDRSIISANANMGTGGNITITTQGLFTARDVDRTITASSNLGFNGVVKIVSPDLDSKIETTQKEEKIISPENLIYTGCSLETDFAANQFRYIGRGGIPHNPLTRNSPSETIADLGTIKSKTKKLKNFSLQQTKISSPIKEATIWNINLKGNLELIARSPVLTNLPLCPKK